MTIIAIEGIDGAGKNTLTNHLAKAIGARTISFPQYGKTIYADKASAELKDQDSSYTPVAMATLFALDRFEAIPELTAPGMIIADRYTSSNIAYTKAQQPGAGTDIALMEERLGVPRADLTILVNTPPDTAGQRAEHRERNDTQRQRDRYEKNSDLQHEVYHCYTLLASTQENWIATRPEDTTDQTVSRIVDYLTEHRML